MKQNNVMSYLAKINSCKHPNLYQKLTKHFYPMHSKNVLQEWQRCGEVKSSCTCKIFFYKALTKWFIFIPWLLPPSMYNKVRILFIAQNFCLTCFTPCRLCENHCKNIKHLRWNIHFRDNQSPEIHSVRKTDPLFVLKFASHHLSVWEMNSFLSG